MACDFHERYARADHQLNRVILGRVCEQVTEAELEEAFTVHLAQVMAAQIEHRAHIEAVAGLEAAGWFLPGHQPGWPR